LLLTLDKTDNLYYFIGTLLILRLFSEKARHFIRKLRDLDKIQKMCYSCILKDFKVLFSVFALFLEENLGFRQKSN
jgi:hypothetical protein